MMCRKLLLGIISGVCFIGAIVNSPLAATPLNDFVQTDINQGAISLERDPAEVAEGRLPAANPLWAIPLGSLSITRERPIFSPTRRPPATPAIIAAPIIAPVVPAPRAAEPEHPPLVLVGTVVGDTEGIGVFIDQSTQLLIRVRTGEGYAGWILRSVTTRETTLEKNNQTETLSLPNLREGGTQPTPRR